MRLPRWVLTAQGAGTVSILHAWLWIHILDLVRWMLWRESERETEVDLSKLLDLNIMMESLGSLLVIVLIIRSKSVRSSTFAIVW